MTTICIRTVKSTAKTYQRRFGAAAHEQAILRAMELEALESNASTFWWAVVSELEADPMSGHAQNQGASNGAGMG
ncbi:hypothetical protein MNBD_ALPHA12-811 [hydrothermal vent metagenome]|uniref:Uncharacterized protein n=1 Tax=hydrothermal vent metagenome TaxID=652676 RepID=A0A3B0U1Q0_9ZZZZ